ncbi:Kelch motif/Galactose oxidase, central domain containing protein [Novymonas esmeraldas]|uniref:Kelch motif/Galactose oxidase, central domain containing protein n=1 Tax=Novymonas esmeraldas TaxID=1808958 RepID=A0AAW0EUC4_9TRYP
MPRPTPPFRHWSLVDCPSEESPLGRIGHSFCANADGSKAYVYGGVNDTDSVSIYLDDLWQYDVINKRWREIKLRGEKQHSRAFHTAVWHGTDMYIFGGCNGRGRFNRLFCISEDGECNQVLVRGTLLPTTRYCHSAVVFGRAMYIFGGKCGGRNSNKRLQDLFRCDLSDPEWKECNQLGTTPPPRSAHTAMTYERTMIVFGGRNSGGECCEDFFVYSFDTAMWRRIDLPQAPMFGRARNSAVVHYGNIIVFGGWNGKKKLNDLFIYNVEANTFEFMYDIDREYPSRRECHVAVVCRNTMVVFGGRFRGNFMNDTTELYLGSKTAVDSIRDWLIVADPQLTGLSTHLPLHHFAALKSHKEYVLPQVPDGPTWPLLSRGPYSA